MKRRVMECGRIEFTDTITLGGERVKVGIIVNPEALDDLLYAVQAAQGGPTRMATAHLAGKVHKRPGDSKASFQGMGVVMLINGNLEGWLVEPMDLKDKMRTSLAVAAAYAATVMTLTGSEPSKPADPERFRMN